MGWEKPYISGDVYDLRYRGGIQIKASSAVQRWGGERVHRIGFSTKASRSYQEEGGQPKWLTAQRNGRCWLFAVHIPSSRDRDQARLEVLDANRWRFWVTDPRSIRFDPVPPRGAASPMGPSHVTLLSVIANTGQGVTREGLKEAVDRVMDGYADEEPAGWTRAVRLDHWEQEERHHLVPDSTVSAAAGALAGARAAYADIAVGFAPGLIRLRRGNRRVAISLEFVRDLGAGKARVLRWRPGEPRSGWDDGVAYDLQQLPQAVVESLA